MIINGSDLAHIDSETGIVTQSVGTLHTYPNDVIIHDNAAFVVNSGVDTGTLQKFDLETWNLTELGIGTGWNCWTALPLIDGKLAVSAALNNSIEMVNPNTMQITSSISGVGPNPAWMAGNNNLLYTACGGWGAGESVVVANITDGSVIDTLIVDTNCQSVVVNDNNYLFATCSGTYGNNEGSVVVIDLSTGNTIVTLSVGGFPAFSVAANDVLYISDPWGAGIYSVDMTSLTVRHDSTNPFTTGGNGMAVDEDGYLWITDGMNSEVRVYDTTETLVQTYSVTSPAAIAVQGSFLGITNNDLPENQIIRVSPNPAVNFVSIAGALPGSSVRIFDITGRTASTSSVDGNGFVSIDVSALKTGLYTVISGSGSARFAVTK